MNPKNEPAIELRDVTFSFDETPLFEKVNLKIHPNEFICMVGPNGGGKTTLLKLILGLYRPREGNVRVFGKSPEEVRQSIGYVPQHSQLDPSFPISAMDVVLMGCLGKGNVVGRYSPEDRKAASRALGLVELEHRAKVPFFNLSGGQRQRILIARSLACEPRILILDEPTSNLDQKFEGEFYDLLTKLGNDMTILLVSHDIGFVSQRVEKVICVNRRVIVHETSALTGDLIREVYGGDVRMVHHDHPAPKEK